MSGFFSQLSLWEIGGLLLVIVILNTVLLKWFMDWNQSHPLDEAESANASPSPARSRPGGAALSTAPVPTTRNETVSDGGSQASGRPRRRKYLQSTETAGGSSVSPEAMVKPSELTTVAAALATASEKHALASAASSTSVPIVSPLTTGTAFSGRSFAEVNPAAAAESPKPAAARLPISAAGLAASTRALASDLAGTEAPATVAPAPAASTSGPGFVRPEEEEAAAKAPELLSRPVDKISLPATRSTPFTRSDLLAKENLRSPTNRITDAPAPPPKPSSLPESTILAPATPAAEPVHLEKPSVDLPESVVTPPADVPGVGLVSPALEASDHSELIAPPPEPILPESAPRKITSSLILPRPAPAAAAEHLLQTDPPTPVAEPYQAVIEKPSEEHGAELKPAPAAVAEPAEPPIATAEPELMPKPSSTDDTPNDTRGTPSGRPVIARRSVGPARIFLTREFSSLRIKSALNPPQTPELAAARARQTLSQPAPATLSEPEASKAQTLPEAKPVTTGYEPIGMPVVDAPTPTGEEAETPSASLQEISPSKPVPVEPAQSVATPAATPELTHEAVTDGAAERPEPTAAELKLEPQPEAPAATVEKLPTVAAGALGIDDPAAEPVATSESTPVPTPVPVEAAKEEAFHSETADKPASPISEHTAVEPTTALPQAADLEESTAAPTAEVVEMPQATEPPQESNEAHRAPVDIEPTPAMLAPVSSGAAREQLATDTAPTTTHSTFSPQPFLMTSAPTSSGERATAQLTFSFEVASLQLTPAFRLGSVQLRPLSNVVTLHLAHGEGQGGGSPLSANIAFEILSAQTGGGSGHGPIQALVLKPLSEARAATTPQPKLAVNAVQLSQGAEGNAPIQITPAQSTSTSVQVLATFAIAGIDFTPLFEIGSMRLEPTSANVLLKLSQGAQTSGMDLPPSFVLTDVDVTGEGQISSMQLVPRGA